MTTGKMYSGEVRSNGKYVAFVNGVSLDPRNGVANHSPDGFQWGFAGSGPMQLALAILCDHFSTIHMAQNFYQDFCKNVVAKFPKDKPWEITTLQVATEVSQIEQRRDHAKQSAAAANEEKTPVEPPANAGTESDTPEVSAESNGEKPSESDENMAKETGGVSGPDVDETTIPKQTGEQAQAATTEAGA